MAGAGITNPGYDLEQQKVTPKVRTLVTIRDNKIRVRSSRHCAARPNQNKIKAVFTALRTRAQTGS
jgi:hypothetical protein